MFLISCVICGGELILNPIALNLQISGCAKNFLLYLIF